MNLGLVTKWLICIAVFSLLVWTSIAVVWGGAGDSVSAHVRDYCAQYPFLPFLLGFVFGHFLWAQKPAVKR